LTLNFDWSLEVKYWSPTLNQKTANRKTLNFHWPKNQPSSTLYGFSKTGLGTTCKITKN
jgi:hypothetical protein